MHSRLLLSGAAALGLFALTGVAPAAAYVFTLDNFTVTKNGTTIFDDGFTDGNAPPNAPPYLNSGSPPPASQYFTQGTFSESGGRVVMDSAFGAISGGVGATDSFVGHFATLNTGINPASTRGLRSGSSFTVDGLFDLVLPTEIRAGFGIRLSDRLVGGSGTPPDQPGDDTIELTVRRQPDGNVYVVLRELDFAADTVTTYQQFLLAPGGYDQINLRLEHSAADNGALLASYTLIDTDPNPAGPVTVAFDLLGGAIFNGEDWTRPMFFAVQPVPEPMSLALFGAALAGFGLARRRKT